MEMDPSKINENGSNPSRNSGGAPQFMLDHDLHHYDTGIIGAGSCSSPSINTITTAATRDMDSPVRQSPRVPRVHNIHIERDEHANSPLSSKVKTTSSKRKPPKKLNRESQENAMDLNNMVDSSNGRRLNGHNTSFDLHNNSAEVEAILLGYDPRSVHRLNRNKPQQYTAKAMNGNNLAPASMRSIVGCDRSMG